MKGRLNGNLVRDKLIYAPRIPRPITAGGRKTSETCALRFLFQLAGKYLSSFLFEEKRDTRNVLHATNKQRIHVDSYVCYERGKKFNAVNVKENNDKGCIF